MSRIGNKAVAIPSGVTANVEGQTVKVKGPKGAMQVVVHDDVMVTMDKAAIKLEPRGESKRARSQWGTSRTLVTNLIAGVTKGFEEKLEITGVGYRAAVQGKTLNLQLGFSHDVNFADPAGHHHRDAEADRDRGDRHRQAAGRPGRRRDPRLPPAGAVQGQGREIRRRIHLPQGRQEEVEERAMSRLSDRTARRTATVRRNVKLAAGTSGRTRLTVFRSSKHIYAQLIDDTKGETLAAASSLEKAQRESAKTGANIAAAKAVGKLIAERAKEKGIKDVVFDRGGYLYHGRVKALADAAREGGLNF